MGTTAVRFRPRRRLHVRYTGHLHILGLWTTKTCDCCEFVYGVVPQVLSAQNENQRVSNRVQDNCVVGNGVADQLFCQILCIRQLEVESSVIDDEVHPERNVAEVEDNG